MKYTEIQTQGQTPLTSFACAVSATGKNEDFHAVAFSADGRFEAFVVLDGEHVVIVSSFLFSFKCGTVWLLFICLFFLLAALRRRQRANACFEFVCTLHTHAMRS